MPKNSPQPLLSYRLKGIARMNLNRTRDMNRVDRLDYRFNLEIHRDQIRVRTENFFFRFHETLFKLQYAGIIRQGNIPYLYKPPTYFFRRIGRFRYTSRIGLNNFLLEPDIVRRKVSPQQIRELISTSIPILLQTPPRYIRRSSRITKLRMKQVYSTRAKLKQLAAESLLDGTFQQKVKSKNNLLGLALQDKSPLNLRDQLRQANERKIPITPNHWRRWIYPDEYSTHRNIHTFYFNQPFHTEVRSADINLYPIVRHIE